MNFADSYLKKYPFKDAFFYEKPNKNLNIVIVIPAYNEDKLLDTLYSLWKCNKPQKAVEVIIIINSAQNETQDIREKNRKTYNEARDWIKKHQDLLLRFFIENFDELPNKHAGAGLARKIGMDEAIRRFNSINNKSGIIVSLDADTLVKENYLVEIEKSFLDKNINVGILNFQHPISGNEFSDDIYFASIKYELYLRYYKNALKFTRFPYFYQTIGSCFAVKVEAYVKQGGMNRRQAGEDFYFLQKIFQLGGITEIKATRVYPSSRPSDRVPFGTGPMIKEISKSENSFDIYNFKAFEDLKYFFDNIEILFTNSKLQNRELFDALSLPLNEFLVSISVEKAITEIKNNVSSLKA
nr:glycosyltransferase [Bacteroidales bacterium]